MRRSGGRSARAAKHQSSAERQFDHAWRNWVNPYPPVEQFSADEIESIHETSMKVLSEIGIKVLSDEACKIYVEAGCKQLDDNIIRFDPDLVLELIAKAPAKVTMHGRGEGRSVTVGGRNVGICTTGGTPNFSDLQNGRRPGSLSSLNDFCRLAQTFDVIHMIGPFVEPQDIPTNIRHLEMTRSVTTLTEKSALRLFPRDRGRRRCL